MSLVSLQRLSTLFGPQPARVLAQRRPGEDPAALLARSGHTLALDQVSLDVAEGELLVVMGASGSGKSTLLRHINRLLRPTAGRVIVAGQDLATLGRAALVRLRRERMAMVFQHAGLLPHRRVLDNVAYGLRLRGQPWPQARQQSMAWIERVGLAGFEQHWPDELSGGMRQRVGLARALATNTDIVLMDEAFAALDPVLRGQLQGELLALQRELHKTIVFVTHDLDEALRLGDRVALLHQGRLLQVDRPATLLQRPADPRVASFLHGVNRARVLSLAAALAPWPAGLPVPALQQAVPLHTTAEQLQARWLGQHGVLGVHDGQRIVGQVDWPALRGLLDNSDHPPLRV